MCGKHTSNIYGYQKKYNGYIWRGARFEFGIYRIPSLIQPDFGGQGIGSASQLRLITEPSMLNYNYIFIHDERIVQLRRIYSDKSTNADTAYTKVPCERLAPAWDHLEI